MNRLLNALRRANSPPPEPLPVNRPAPTVGVINFDERLDILCRHAEQAAAYEDDLLGHLKNVEAQLAALGQRVDAAIDAGQDRQAFEFVRLAARFKPQRDLLLREVQAFHLIAEALRQKLTALLDHTEEARAYALDGALNPAASHYLDTLLNKLTRYFVMLERVALARRRGLPDALAKQLTRVLDDRQLDLDLANYVMIRRRALGSGKTQRQ
jgi:hypothetical protein